jgi:two-component system, cell cycle sensor histidine kinase and response regulator CckA
MVIGTASQAIMLTAMSLLLHQPRILVVDDDDGVRWFAERGLRMAGYDVTGAPSGAAALETVAAQGTFDAFVVDMRMPEMSGDELAAQLRHIDPDAKILYFTAFCDHLFARKPTLWENEAFIEKPISLEGLLEAVSLLALGHTKGPDPSFRKAFA